MARPDVLIVGGGIMGVGLLYHLALEGWTDVVLIEKGELTSGSTWHAAGQCPHFNGSLNMTKVHVYGTELYPRLEKLTGQAVSWHGCGGLRLAQTDEEVNWLKYVEGISKLGGYEGEIIGPFDALINGASYVVVGQVVDVRAAGELTFEDAREQIRNVLAAQKRQERIFEDLREKTYVEIRLGT